MSSSAQTTSRIHTLLNRQGWRVIEAPTPQVDHAKRRIGASSLEELVRIHLRLSGWQLGEEDYAASCALACVINYHLDADNSAEHAQMPEPADQVQGLVGQLVEDRRSDLVVEIARAHESWNEMQLLASRLRWLLDQPHLLAPIAVDHTFQVKR